MLFDALAHEPLLDAPWSPASAEAAIRAIAQDAGAALRDGRWWPLHPQDDDGRTPELLHGVYLGAAGVLWALDRLARAGLHEPGHDYGRLAGEVLESYLREPEFGGPLPSAWLGEGGIALVAWLLSPSPALADRLAALLVADPAGDTVELMSGSPGLLTIARALLERTGEERWASAATGIARHLQERWGEHVTGLWTQHVYGSTQEILGAAHGSAGVVAALARRELPPGMAGGITEAFVEAALRERGLANWAPERGGSLVHRTGTIRVQWCHGAPGIVASLAGLPSEGQLDEVLLAGGELTWTAGPLRKGANLCHGTAGNGFALLKLFTRTGDERWLERARRFAMHAAAQVEAARREHGRGRYSLWTGDPGTAIFLLACLRATSELPAIDDW